MASIGFTNGTESNYFGYLYNFFMVSETLVLSNESGALRRQIRRISSFDWTSGIRVRYFGIVIRGSGLLALLRSAS